MKVYNMTSTKGNKVPYQFKIENGGKVYFQSYNSIVALWKGYQLELGRDWDYSVTTMKYLKNFLESECIPLHNAKEIRKAIKDGFSTYDNGVKILVNYNERLGI